MKMQNYIKSQTMVNDSSEVVAYKSLRTARSVAHLEVEPFRAPCLPIAQGSELQSMDYNENVSEQSSQPKSATGSMLCLS